MKFGYIKINEVISKIFVATEDDQITKQVKQLRESLSETNAIVEWDSFWTDKSPNDIVEFCKKSK